MDLFEKCYVPALQDEIREKELYPYFHALESRQDVTVTMEGKRRIMLGSNNYLGLTVQPEVVEAGIAALRQYGTGCSGSRFLNGTLKLHLELEDALALPGSKVLMKSGRRLPQVVARLSQKPGLHPALALNCGLEDEYLCPDLADYDGRQSYFATFLVEGEERS